MRRIRAWLTLLCLTAALVGAAWTPMVRAGEPPPDDKMPMPGSCGGTNATVVCCISGTVTREGRAVKQALVTIKSQKAQLVLKLEAEDGALSYYADLSTEPLLVNPGDRITITADDGFGSVTVEHEVEHGPQRVDLELVRVDDRR